MNCGRFFVALWLCSIAIISVLPSDTVRAAEPDAPVLTARHAIVIDATSGAILFAKASDERVAPASLTKLITAAVAIESVPLNAKMTVSEADLIGEASMDLVPGESLTFNALLHGMLMASGNDSALTVARESAGLTDDSSWQAVRRFLDRANMRIAELDMRDTHLANPHGLDEAGHYSTARDLAAIALHITRTSPELLAIAGTPVWHGEGHDLSNTNELLGRDPDVIAGKTGFTADAGYCLVEIARRGDRTIIAVVLGSTAEDWYTDASTLLDFGFAIPVVSGVEPNLGHVTTEPAVRFNASTDSASPATTTLRFADDGSLVRVATLGELPQWRQFVVALVGFATVSACVGLWLAGSGGAAGRTQRQRSAAAPTMPATFTAAQIWETQQLSWGSREWDSSRNQQHTRLRSGWTAAFPLLDDSNQQPGGPYGRRTAVIRPIGPRGSPAWRPNSSD